MKGALVIVSTTHDPLLGPGAESLELGLMCARTAAVLRRIAVGSEADSVDRGILRTAELLIAASADATDAIVSGGRSGHMPSGHRFSAVALTIESAAPQTDDSEVSERLRTLATALECLQRDAKPDLAQKILPVFASLTDAAIREAGTTGESAGIGALV